METGVKTRHPHRKMFSSETTALIDINKYKSYSDVYHSIYWFAETEEKRDRHNNFMRIGPNYHTAIINKIIFDLDAFQKNETTGIEHYEFNVINDFRKLVEWAKEKDLRRQYKFSGGGFHVVIEARGEPLKLKDATLSILQEVGIEADPSVIGDTARMIRVTNSFNFGEHRQCYCIPLEESEIYLPYEQIKRLASEPRIGKRYVYGDVVYGFNHCKIDKDKIKLKKLFINLKENPNANKILEDYGWEVIDFCDTIKYIIGLKHVSNYLRYELIKYLKSVVRLSFEDCVNLIVALLGPDGYHSAQEGQAKFVYAYDRLFNPKKLKTLGYCKLDCDRCMKWRRIV